MYNSFKLFQINNSIFGKFIPLIVWGNPDLICYTHFLIFHEKRKIRKIITINSCVRIDRGVAV